MPQANNNEPVHRPVPLDRWRDGDCLQFVATEAFAEMS